MIISFIKDPYNFVPKQKFGTEIVLFPWGIIISKTNPEKILFESYNQEKDSTEFILGYYQEQKVKGFRNGEKIDYVLKKKIPLKAWNPEDLGNLSKS